MGIRASKNRAIRQEGLRIQIAAGNHLANIKTDYDELGVLNNEIKDAKDTDTDQYVVSNVIVKADARHKIIKTRLHTSLQLLKKLLPDEQFVEVKKTNDVVHTFDLSSLSEVQLDSLEDLLKKVKSEVVDEEEAFLNSDLPVEGGEAKCH